MQPSKGKEFLIIWIRRNARGTDRVAMGIPLNRLPLHLSRGHTPTTIFDPVVVNTSAIPGLDPPAALKTPPRPHGTAAAAIKSKERPKPAFLATWPGTVRGCTGHTIFVTPVPTSELASSLLPALSTPLSCPHKGPLTPIGVKGLLQQACWRYRSRGGTPPAAPPKSPPPS
jgi:hypothetical protein